MILLSISDYFINIIILIVFQKKILKFQTV